MWPSFNHSVTLTEPTGWCVQNVVWTRSTGCPKSLLVLKKVLLFKLWATLGSWRGCQCYRPAKFRIKQHFQFFAIFEKCIRNGRIRVYFFHKPTCKPVASLVRFQWQLQEKNAWTLGRGLLCCFYTWDPDPAEQFSLFLEDIRKKKVQKISHANSEWPHLTSYTRLCYKSPSPWP